MADSAKYAPSERGGSDRIQVSIFMALCFPRPMDFNLVRCQIPWVYTHRQPRTNKVHCAHAEQKV